MTHITRSIRKYAAAYREYPSRILEYSPSILSLCISCVFVAYWPIFARVRVSCVFSRILAYSPRILHIRVFSRIRRVFVAYPAHSRVFSSTLSRILAYSPRTHPRILAYSRVFIRVFSRIHRVFAAYSRVFLRVPAYPPHIRVRVWLYESWSKLKVKLMCHKKLNRME